MISAAALAVASAIGWSAVASANEHLPVHYGFFSGIPFEISNPGGALPGSVDWQCQPAADRPNPVVLVHGTGGGAQTNWGAYAPLLSNEGYCVFALTYGAHDAPWPLSAIGGMRPIEDSAAELAEFVDRVLVVTGASKVDVVGHSQGTIVPSYYAKYLGGADKIDKYVSLAPLWNGSEIPVDGIAAVSEQLGVGRDVDALLSLCGACEQFLPGSALLEKLHEGGVYVPGITYTNIMTRYDQFVLPYTSGFVEGANATSIVVQDACEQDFSDHLAIAGSPCAAAYVLNALDPGLQAEVPCTFVPPLTG